MSLTVEALAKAIFDQPKTFIAGATKRSAMDKAMALWPLIERHIAAGQTLKPAGNAIDGLLATARPFLAEELLLKQGYTWSGSDWVAPATKPAGAVPLPEPGVADADGKPFAYWPDQLRAYGDAREAAAPHALREKLCSCEEALAAAEAREAAGRAVAAVSDHIRRQVGKIDKYRLCMSHNESYFGEPAGLLKSVVTELAHAVDPIYPEPTPEVDPLAGVTVYTETGTHTAPFAPVPQQPAAEGETRDEKIARVQTSLREQAKRFRDPIELAQEIHGTAPRDTVGDVESLASALATAHTQWGAKSSETRGSLYAHMAKTIFDRIERANFREAYIVECVHTTTQEGTCFFEVKTDDPPESGAKLYTRPTPAADAGGVTEISEALESIRIAADNGGMNEGQCYSIWRTLTAALAPEVRHG